jgi:hypothetical protein
MGLKPVVGEALATFRAMREDDSFRSRVVGEATDRLRARGLEEEAQPAEPGPRLVDPEEVIAERVEVVPSAVTRQMIRAEALLVRHYCGWLDPSGVRLRGVIIPAPGHVLRADLYDTERELLIEAKAEASRESLRYAIGQLFDYRRYLDRCRSVRALALLVPSAPDPDLALLPGAAGVAIIWRTDDGFTDSVDGQYTRRTQTPLTGLARDT